MTLALEILSLIRLLQLPRRKQTKTAKMRMEENWTFALSSIFWAKGTREQDYVVMILNYNDSNNPRETSVVLIDFNRAERLDTNTTRSQIERTVSLSSKNHSVYYLSIFHREHLFLLQELFRTMDRIQTYHGPKWQLFSQQCLRHPRSTNNIARSVLNCLTRTILVCIS